MRVRARSSAPTREGRTARAWLLVTGSTTAGGSVRRRRINADQYERSGYTALAHERCEYAKSASCGSALRDEQRDYQARAAAQVLWR